MSNQNQRGHILDGAYVPRCANCLQRGSQCIDHSIPRRWGQPVDHCNYYTSQRHDLLGAHEASAWATILAVPIPTPEKRKRR